MAGRRFTRRLWFACLAVALGGSAIVSTPSAAGVSSCVLAPVHRDTTINQGLGSYDPLARGKETLVRFFLSMPSCATEGDRIEITSATLHVSNSSGVVPIGSTPLLGEKYPVLPPHSSSPTSDTPGNPLFVVPGALLDSAGDAPFTVSFQATFEYRATPVTGGSSTGSSTFPSPTTHVARQVAPATSPLRVLVVPMGNTDDLPSRTLPPQALAALHNGMRTLSRLLPVRDGIGPLAPTAADASAGLQYSVMPGMVNLGPGFNGENAMELRNGQYVYCGAKFDDVSAALASWRFAWNIANPQMPADRVVGVVWQDVAPGVAGSCDEGRSVVNGRESWVRISSDGVDGQAMTGPVLGMEILHNLAAATGTHSDGKYHSKNLEADGTSVNRGYNTSLRQYLSDDRSVMRIGGSGWTNRNVLLEKPDWDQAVCRLTPASANSCPGSDATGTAAAGPAIVIGGTADEDHQDGQVSVDLHTYLADSAVGAEEQPGSPYRVIQRDALGAELSATPVPVRDVSTEHGEHDHARAEGAVLDVVVPAQPGVAAFELQKDGAVVYRRQAGLAPEVVSATASPDATGSRQLITVTAASANPEELRLDVLLTGCGPTTDTVFAGLRPALPPEELDLSIGTSTFVATLDRARICSNGSLTAFVSDGFLRGSAPIVAIGEPPPPDGAYHVSAAIATPADGSTFLQYDAIPILGTARDANDEAWPEQQLRWTVVLPDGNEVELAERGSSIPDLPPDLPNGRAPGDYGMRLDVLDQSGGVVASAEVQITVYEDKDHDGVPHPEPGCFGDDADHDPLNAYVDHDHDGYVGSDDGDPCVSATNVTVDFDPNTLYVPSVGNWVTLYVDGEPDLLAAVDAASVELSQIGGYAARLPAASWQLQSATRAVVKVDKQQLNAFLSVPERHLIGGGYIPMVLTSGGSGAAIRGLDPQHPIVKPA